MYLQVYRNKQTNIYIYKDVKIFKYITDIKHVISDMFAVTQKISHIYIYMYIYTYLREVSYRIEMRL